MDIFVLRAMYCYIPYVEVLSKDRLYIITAGDIRDRGLYDSLIKG